MSTIQTFQERLYSAYASLLSLLQNDLYTLDPAFLYHHPILEEWSIMENLAHIVEFFPYWAGEFDKLVRNPGQPFGRTQRDEARLTAIKLHAHDQIDDILATLPGSYAHINSTLSQFSDQDLLLTGVHISMGEHTLDYFLEHFVVGHLEAHVQQIQAVLTQQKETN